MAEVAATYRCQGFIVRSPEGGNIICPTGRTVQRAKDRCQVTCEIGNPNYLEIECKEEFGWRPTNKLECTGVAPGVVVGLLIGGFIVVIIVAVLYAKYKQEMKKKQEKKNPTPAKQRGSRRPGTAVPANQVPAVPAKPATAATAAAVPKQKPKVPLPVAPASKNTAASYGSQMSAKSDSSIVEVASVGSSKRSRRSNPPPASVRGASRKPRAPSSVAETGEYNYNNRAYEKAPVSYRYQPSHHQGGYQGDPYHGGPYAGGAAPQVGFGHLGQQAPPRPSRESTRGGVYSIQGHPY